MIETQNSLVSRMLEAVSLRPFGDAEMETHIVGGLCPHGEKYENGASWTKDCIPLSARGVGLLVTNLQTHVQSSILAYR